VKKNFVGPLEEFTICLDPTPNHVSAVVIPEGKMDDVKKVIALLHHDLNDGMPLLRLMIKAIDWIYEVICERNSIQPGNRYIALDFGDEMPDIFQSISLDDVESTVIALKLVEPSVDDNKILFDCIETLTRTIYLFVHIDIMIENKSGNRKFSLREMKDSIRSALSFSFPAMFT